MSTEEVEGVCSCVKLSIRRRALCLQLILSLANASEAANGKLPLIQVPSWGPVIPLSITLDLASLAYLETVSWLSGHYKTSLQMNAWKGTNDGEIGCFLGSFVF